MEFLKEFLGDDLYTQVEAKLKGNDKVKLANLASGEYVSKSKYDDEIKAKDTKITELSDTVKKFDGVDVAKLQQDVKDWEKKYQDDLTSAKKETAIKLAIAEAKPKSEKALMAFLDTDIVKLNDDGTVTGLKEQLENIKKDNGFLFEEADPQNVNLGGDHDNKPETKESTWESALDDHYGKE